MRSNPLALPGRATRVGTTCARAASACIAVCSAAWIALSPADSRGQEQASGTATESVPHPSPSQLRHRTPPRIEELSTLELPEGLSPSEAELEVIVRVDADGRGVVEQSAATGELRARIEDVVGRARFVPARIDDVPVAARVRLRLGISTDPDASTAADSSSDQELADLERGQLGARAHVDPPRPTARKLTIAEMRDLPGAFGDPFRVLDSLPGVVPLLSGLPYVYVRGAPPAGTIYVYDGIVMPALFHLALGPAVIHPALIGDLQFYSAVPPARYGRRTGGVFAAQGRKPDSTGRLRAEAELRLLDVSAMVDVPLGEQKHRVTAAVRYGYPGLLLSAFAEDVSLAYWDYQLRYSLPLNHLDRFELTWFGSYDYLGDASDPDDDSNFALQFHRIETRIIREHRNFELGFALQGGFEESSLGSAVSIEAFRLGPRLWADIDLGPRARLRTGADMLSAIGRIRTERDDEPTANPSFPEDIEQDDARLFNNPLFAAVSGRNLGGVYVELDLALTDTIALSPGLRTDAWLTGSHAQTAIDPRLVATYRPSELLQLHAGAGLGHQVAALPIALPGFNDVALERGLQRAISTEAGVAITPGHALRFEATAFFNHLTGLILPDLLIECSDSSQDVLCPSDSELPRGHVNAYGLELFAKRDATERLSGWLSYTLGWAEGQSQRGLNFTPAFDVRHVGNLVVQWQLGGGFAVGGRAHYRSGKVARETAYISPTFDFGGIYAIERRLPDFFRADAQVTYGWTTSWGRMRLSIEWMNLTLSREATDITCNEVFDPRGHSTRQVQCTVEYFPAIFFPNLGLRGEL